MKSFRLTVSTPDGNLFEGDIVSISLRGVSGELAIMAGHIPFVTSVKPCRSKVLLEDDSEMIFSTEGGILSVSSEGVRLMSGTCKIED